MRIIAVQLLLILGILLGPLLEAWAQDKAHHLAVIVNPTNVTEDLSIEKLRRIFRGEEAEWDNGTKIEVITRASGQPEQEAALHGIYGTDQQSLNAFFLKASFARTLKVKPKILNTSAGVRQIILGVPGAIGYIRASEVEGSVKTLRVNGRLPGEPGYELTVQ